MDEIDGCAGNEDRGGVSALNDIIKTTRIPIIFICNDKWSQKLKSLANNCYDLPFSKPDKRQISAKLIQICNKEGLKVEEAAIGHVVESVGNDIRQCLNFLQMWARKTKTMQYFDLKNKYNNYSKDSGLMLSNFDVCQKMLKRDVRYSIIIIILFIILLSLQN